MRAFCLPPVCRGSTYVPRPTWVTTPGRPAAISRMSCESTPCGNEYDSISSGLDERAQPRLVADVAADGPAHEPGQAQLREAAVGEVADADDPDRGQVTGRAGLRVDRGQLVDEALRAGRGRRRSRR